MLQISYIFEDHMGKEALTMNEDTDSKDAKITFPLNI